MPTMPWIAHYDSGVPHTVDMPPISSSDILSRTAQTHPEAPAILFYGRTITYDDGVNVRTGLPAAHAALVVLLF
ncbi:MAG: hypothetical protein H7Y32_08595 [Chloroflexales bacterium]|nr:hypothetical protein [Chloroflexales bacterium]